jgi:pyruvate carboxylase
MPGCASGELATTPALLLRLLFTHSLARASLRYVIGGREQHVKVKDAQGDDAFDGEYADADDANHVGAPMPGVVEGFSAKAGQVVEEGDELAVVCAMKMEIKVKAPHAGKVSRTLVQLGDKVVEGALLVVVEPL